MAEVFGDELATFPLPRVCPFRPPAEYERLRARQPVARVRMAGGNTAWLVTRHADFRTVLSDPRLSADRRRPGFPRFAPAASGTKAPARPFSVPLNWMDSPDHEVARRSVLGAFSPRQVHRLRPRIQRITDDCVERLLDGPKPADLVKAVAMVVPSRVICELLGVPYEHHEYFESRTTTMFARSGPAEARVTAGQQIQELLEDVVRDRNRAPRDDLISRLLAKPAPGTADAFGAVVSMAFVLLVAGHVTTSNVISLGTLALLENPAQLALLRAEPHRLPAAVEEILRYCSIVEAATARTALADVDLGDVTIRAGDGVVAVGQTANRDPDVFERPDELDVRRDARGHVAFGFGRHQCLGQGLARAELRIVFGTLLRRIPLLRCAVPIEDIPFKVDGNIYGVHELPVTW